MPDVSGDSGVLIIKDLQITFLLLFTFISLGVASLLIHLSFDSALMKLCDQHSCDSFLSNQKETLSVSDMSLARELTLRCLAGLKQAIPQILSLIETLNKEMDKGTLLQSSVAPWFLNCIYRAAVALSWMGHSSTAEEMEMYATAKVTCVSMLRRMSNRWNVAGMYHSALLNFLEHFFFRCFFSVLYTKTQ